MTQQDPKNVPTSTETFEAIFATFKKEIQELKYEQEKILQDYVSKLAEKKNTIEQEKTAG